MQGDYNAILRRRHRSLASSSHPPTLSGSGRLSLILVLVIFTEAEIGNSMRQFSQVEGYPSPLDGLKPSFHFQGFFLLHFQGLTKIADLSVCSNITVLYLYSNKITRIGKMDFDPHKRLREACLPENE